MKLLNKSLLGAALAMALNLDANAVPTVSITPDTPFLMTFVYEQAVGDRCANKVDFRSRSHAGL